MGSVPPPLKTGSGIPDGNKEDLLQVVYLPAIPSQPGLHGDPAHSSSDGGSSDSCRRGRRERSPDSDHKKRSKKKKKSHRGKLEDSSDSNTARLDFRNSEEDFNLLDSFESDDVQERQYRSGRRSLRRLRPWKDLFKKVIDNSSYNLLKNPIQYASKVAKYIGRYHETFDI